MNRLYIVEDEALIAIEIADRLSALGYEIVGTASRADRALVEIETLKPDLVLIDMRLGEGVTGIGIAQRLHDRGEIPVVFLTAYSDPNLLRQAAETEPFGYLVKPFEERELHATVETALQRHRAERALRETNAKLRAAQAALEISKELFESLAASSPTAVFRTDAAGRCTYVNRRWEEITGIDSADAHNAPWTNALHPLDHASVAAEWNAAGRRAAQFQAELRVGGSADSWVIAQTAPLRGPDGAMIGHVGTLTDIADRKKTESALQLLSNLKGARSEFPSHIVAGLAALFDADFAFLAQPVAGDPESARTLAYWADGKLLPGIAYKIAGTPCETVVGKEIRVYEDGVQKLFSRDAALVPLGVNAYAAAPIRDSLGRYCGHFGVMRREPIVKPSVVQGVLELLSVPIAAELDRANAEQKYSGLFEFAADGILMVDASGKLQLANRKAESIFGYGVGELTGCSVESLVPLARRPNHPSLREAFTKVGTPR